MAPVNPYRLRRLIGLLIFAGLLASCRSVESAVKEGEDGLFPAPEFASFWSDGGGLATYGPPITPPRRAGVVLQQTFLAVEMISDPNDRAVPVRLAPLGWELGLAEPAAPPTNPNGAGYFKETGHTLYPGFAQLFRDLGGEAVVGAPITEVSFRDGQIIQYFENLGMARPENASPAETRLVALGLAARPTSIGFGLDSQSAVAGGIIRQRPFAPFLEPLGGEALFGQPLTGPYLDEEGALEQVYERAVVFSPDGSAKQAGFRPLGTWMGPAQDPVPPSKEDGGLYFESSGHNVTLAFADFYREQEGDVILGLPLEEMTLEQDRMRQRFEYGVLEYRFDLPPELALQLAPSGRAYLAAHPPPTAEPTPYVLDEGQLRTSVPGSAGSLRVGAVLGSTVLAPRDRQTIRVTVVDSEGAPVSGASVALRILGRAGARLTALPDTDSDGVTILTWTDEDPVSGEVVRVIVQAIAAGRRAEAILQYAYGFGPAATATSPGSGDR